MKAILLALWLLLWTNLHAQPVVKDTMEINKKGALVKGIVKSESGKALEGATVNIMTAVDSLNLATSITDKNGGFEFNGLKTGNYYLIIHHVGFSINQTQSFFIKSEKNVVDLKMILLNMEDQKLKEVVIRAAQKPMVEHKIDRTVVNVGSLLSNVGTTAIEVLNNVPGIEVVDDVISLRGKQGVTVYIDDKQSFLQGKELLNYLKALPSGMLDAIELMPNPPAKYRTNGAAGVINIKTKKNSTQGLNGNFSASQSRGRYSRSNYNMNISYKKDKFNIFNSIGYSTVNNAYDIVRFRKIAGITINQHNREWNKNKSISYKVGLDYDFNQKNSIQFVADGFQSPYKEKGDYLLEFNANSLDSIMKTISAFEQKTSNMSAGFNYRHKFNNSGKEISVNLDYLDFNENSHQNLESSTFIPAEANSVSNYGLTSDNPFRAKVHSVKSDFEGKILWDVKLSSGLQSIYSARKTSRNYSDPRNQAENASVNNSNFAEYINSAYTSLSKEFKVLSVQAGLRYESNQTATQQFTNSSTPLPLIKVNYNNFVPSFYLSYKLDSLSANQFIFSCNSRINRPSYSSLNPSAFFFDKYTVLRGNAMLQPERSKNFELAFHHQSKLTIALVCTRSKNMIINTYQLEGKSLISSQSNVDTYSNVGLNMNSILKISSYWTANLYGELSNLSFRDKLFIGDIDIVTYRFTGNNQFKFQKGWSGEVSGSYRSKTTFGQGTFEPIWRVNTSIQKKLLKGKSSLTLSGSDLFHSWVSKRNIDLSEAQISVVNRNDTRQVNLSFTYKFGSGSKVRQNKGGLDTEKQRTGAQ